MKKFFLKLQSGQSLVEILLVIGLSAILLPALLTGLVASREGKVQQSQRTQALYILNETVDSVRSVREKGWTPFAVNGTFYPVISGSSWTLASGSTTIDGFTRSVVIADVNRDSSGAIVTSGGTLDPSSKKVDASISWEQPYASTVSASLYITRYLENNAFAQTTEADFNGGTKTGTAVTNTLGGEVTLGAGGHGDWCRPGDFIVGQADLPQNGAARRVKAIEGKAFTGTDQAGTGNFVELSISNDDPPIATISGTLPGYETNDVFIDGNYAYIATDDVNKDMVIIDLTTNQEVGYFNGSNNFLLWPVFTAGGVFVQGNVGYLTIGPRFYTVDLTSKTGSRPAYDSIFIDLGLGHRLQVVGEYAYIAMEYLNNELRLINVSDPSNITRAARANVNGERGQEVFVNQTGTRAYLATDESGSYNEFFIINTDVPPAQKNNQSTNLSVISSYNSNGMDPRGVTAVPGNRAILVGIGGEEYQVIDISNENSPTQCGGTQVNSGIYGISTILEADGDAYSYIVTGDESGEFKIIEGGPGGQYASSGEFESSTFDPGYQTAFNRFDVSVERPANTDIKFHVAVEDEISGSCTGVGFTFVGPDATSATFFETAVTAGTTVFNYGVPGSINPGRCFRYKSYFSTADFTSTPIFYDMTLNYSP